MTTTMDARGIAPVKCRFDEKPARHYAGRFVAEHREIMWALQGGRCAICGAGLKLSDAKADHCHDTGMPRSTICNGCNTFEGAYWKAYREGGDTVAIIRRYDDRARAGFRGRAPRGWMSYGLRAEVLKERYWPMWDLWAEQAVGLREGYERAGQGKRPDGLIVMCNALVLTRWRGAVASSEGGRILWEKAKAEGLFLLPCWKAVQPDTRRAFRVLAGVTEKAALPQFATIFREAA